MTDGTVTMSLAQVDQLRDEIKSKGVTIDALKKEIEEVKADKRTVEITKYQLVYPQPTGVRYREMYRGIAAYMNAENNNSYGYDHNYQMHKEENLAQQLYKFFSFTRPREFGILDPYQKEDKIDYRDFEDVKLELREALDKEYNTEIGRLKAEEKDYTRKIEESRQKFENDLTSAKNDFYKREENLKEEIKIWEEKYEALLSDKDTRSTIQKLEDELEELKKQLVEEKSKPWWRKIVN